MKMVVAFIQPFMTDKVVQALHGVEGLSGAGFWNVHGFGRGRGDEPGAARHQEILGAIRKVRVEVMVREALEDTVVLPVSLAANVVSLQLALRIRTGEEGETAV
jgi:nitrogen regulatory protein PII